MIHKFYKFYMDHSHDPFSTLQWTTSKSERIPTISSLMTQ